MEKPESVRKLYVSLHVHGTCMTHIKGNFDLSEILEKNIIRASLKYNSFIWNTRVEISLALP